MCKGVKYILTVLIEGLTWESLTHCKLECDISAIRKKYYSWVSRGYIDQFHLLMIDKYSKYKSEFDTNDDRYGDSTTIINYYGLKEDTGRGIKFRGKQSTTLHTHVDNNRIITSMSLTPANKSDISQVEILVDTAFIPMNGTYRNPSYLACDKAYISDAVSTSLKKQNIILTCPQKRYKKKQKKKNIQIISNKKTIKKLSNKNKLKNVIVKTQEQIENDKKIIIKKIKQSKLNKRLLKQKIKEERNKQRLKNIKAQE